MGTHRNTVSFFVPGQPQGMPRARACLRGSGTRRFVQMYTPSGIVAYQRQVQAAARSHLPEAVWGGPVRLTLSVYFERPQRLLRRVSPTRSVPHTGKPDIDNVVKAVMDALTKCELWNDDAQVCQLEIRKQYVPKDGRPGVLVVARHLDENEPITFFGRTDA